MDEFGNGGIFGTPGGIFGPAAGDTEYLDALEEPYRADGRDPTDVLLESRRRLAERQRMLLIERFVDEWPETPAFVIHIIESRIRLALKSKSERSYDAVYGEPVAEQSIPELAFSRVRDATVNSVGNIAGTILYHARLRHEMTKQEAVERLGGPAIADVHGRIVHRIERAIEKRFDRVQEWLAKSVWGWP